MNPKQKKCDASYPPPTQNNKLFTVIDNKQKDQVTV